MTFGKEFRVLMVDDDAASLIPLADTLRNIGITGLLKANSGAEALLKLPAQDKPVDCILCNWGMTDVNGLQVLQQIRLGRVQRVRSDACFILMTRTRSPAVIQAAKDLDVSGYLIKPISGQKLKDSITKARSRVLKVRYEHYAKVTVPAFAPSDPFAKVAQS